MAVVYLDKRRDAFEQLIEVQTPDDDYGRRLHDKRHNERKWNDDTPDAIVSKDANGVLLIKNISPDKWTVETPSGKVKTVESQDIMPVKEGLKITFKIREIPYRGEITNCKS